MVQPALSPPKGGSKQEFLHFVCMAVNRRHFKFGMPIYHSKSQPTHDKLSLKWAWSRHVILFKFQGPKHNSGITEARIAKFLTLVVYI